MIKIEKLKLRSQKQFELIDVTEKVAEVVTACGVLSGVVTIFAPHTTASVRINHNEPLLKQDLMNMIYKLVPVDMNYSHDLYENRTETDASERSNAHAHVKAFLLGASESIPFENGKMILGPKQSIFFIELDGGRSRSMVVEVCGE